MNQQTQEKIYVIGTQEKNIKALLSVGRFYALDGSYGKTIYMDASHPHIISIFGKRGYGKSYTLGVLIEELAKVDRNIRNDLSVIIIDTLGIFWTMIYPNIDEKNILEKWNKEPTSIKMNLLSPEIKKNDIKDRNACVLSIPPHQMTPDIWCDLFQVTSTSPFGIALTEAIYRLQSTKNTYQLKDIFNKIDDNPSVSNETKQLANNFYHYAQSLGIFHDGIKSLNEILRPGTINCIDLSLLPSTQTKQIVTGIISNLVFQQRIKARKHEELSLINKTDNTSSIPKVWMFIDEAQLFLPKSENPYCKQVLMEQWLRQGRQPGVSLVLATQQPSAIDHEVFSHSDLIFCHRLTSQHDILALHQIRPSYMKETIATIVKKMGYEKGVCTIIDDTMEQAHICKIRPRITWHAGHEPKIGISTKKGE